MNDLEKYLRVSQFAKRKNISPQAVRKRLDELNTVVFGGIIFIINDERAEKFEIDEKMKRR